VTVKITIACDVTPCSLIDIYHLQFYKRQQTYEKCCYLFARLHSFMSHNTVILKVLIVVDSILKLCRQCAWLENLIVVQMHRAVYVIQQNVPLVLCCSMPPSVSKHKRMVVRRASWLSWGQLNQSITGTTVRDWSLWCKFCCLFLVCILEV